MLLSTLVVALTMSMAPAPQAAPVADLQTAYKELKAAEEKKDRRNVEAGSRYQEGRPRCRCRSPEVQPGIRGGSGQLCRLCIVRRGPDLNG